jgi:hypothetical protein
VDVATFLRTLDFGTTSLHAEHPAYWDGA